jgi:hypothetical protein
LRKLIVLFLPLFLAACASGRPPAERIRAVQGSIPGVPIPAGSVKEGRYDGGGGVLMVFYARPGLEAGELLRFFEVQMPAWGWRSVVAAAPQPRQLTFERNGVPVLIGVEAEGGRFSIIRGAHGDWGFMPQLRDPR